MILRQEKIFLFITLLIYCSNILSYSSLANNDPVPVYSTLDPQDYLTQKYRAYLKGWTRCSTETMVQRRTERF